VNTGKSAGLIDYALLFGLAALWGSSFIFIKISVDEIPPLTQTAYRLFIAMVLVFDCLICAFRCGFAVLVDLVGTNSRCARVDRDLNGDHAACNTSFCSFRNAG